MYYLSRNRLSILLIVLLFLFGCLFIIVSAKLLIEIIMYMVAILLIMIALSFIANSRQYLGRDKIKLILQSVFLIALASSIFFVPSYIIRPIIGVFFIIIPLVHLFHSHNRWVQFQKDIVKYIIGIILILSFEIILEIVLIAFGIILILIGFYLTFVLIKNRKDVNNPNILFKMAVKYFMRKERGIWE